MAYPKGRRRFGRSRRGDGRSPAYGALDLGTNNCRLLVARPAAGGFRIIDAFSRIVRLGEGLGASGELSEAAIERTIEALQVCAAKMQRRGVTKARSVATEACRRAVNGSRFLRRVTEKTGLRLEIISPREEARLTLAGCASLLDAEVAHALMFDIGGGSTELIWLSVSPGTPPDMLASLSLPCGVVSLAERYGGREVSAAAYEAMVCEVGELLRPFEARHGIGLGIADGAVQMLGTSGTVTTLTAIHLDLPRYDRAVVDGSYLSFASIARINRKLAGMDYDRRVSHPCIGVERADLVIAGAAILEAICRLWPVGRLRVADRGLREGILLGLMRPGAAFPAAPPE
ncbi:MAG: Ppx/GppA family phosphatase [Alphaproteobacteria bacterium]